MFLLKQLIPVRKIHPSPNVPRPDRHQPKQPHGTWHLGTVTTAALGALIVASALAGGKSDTATTRETRARSFVIKDGSGRARALLHFSAGPKSPTRYSNPALHFIGPDGKVRFEFCHDDELDATFVRVLDAAGEHVTVLTSDSRANTLCLAKRGGQQPLLTMQTWREAGGPAGSTLSLSSPRGVPQLDLGVSPQDAPGWQFYDRDGKLAKPE